MERSDHQSANHKKDDMAEKEHIINSQVENGSEIFNKDDRHYNKKNELYKEISKVNSDVKTLSVFDRSNHLDFDDGSNASSKTSFIAPILNNSAEKKGHIENKFNVNRRSVKKRKANKISSKSRVKVDHIINRANGKNKLSHAVKKRINYPIHQNETDIIRSKIIKNWNIPPDLKKLRKVHIKINLRFKKDGYILEKPYIKVVGGTTIINRILTDNAFRAVMKSQPFYLPANNYDNWRNITLNLNPSKM
ncbi:TolA protein [Candidatus Liberibacter americanus str. Sao Paulo]|uniref:TolA protein n=2 Tax=Candidatus Liberibacter americanus TaxID=309868 RepID=U6B5I1_9HYPH|nr:TolA protein [Candidatus Liberibacter americanus str. Sao Paulo]